MRFSLARLRPGLVWKTMWLTTTGRRSGQPRSVLLAYLDDGANLVTLAMNGWADPEPAWWLNLQANPDATVEHDGRTRPVRARAAAGEERERLWARWRDSDQALDAYAALRTRETAVVVLEPHAGPDPASRWPVRSVGASTRSVTLGCSARFEEGRSRSWPGPIAWARPAGR